ncbi:ABC transporter ATP-binding protein/permease [Laspinema olomoucense]|uniref:ABC transporter ATP-binding protein/permease n=1 Tax=Laspinema olomoucense TaxID=3231600 RepID=UPI0021BB4DE5|nr:ABC transporter ATP-binding protein/permease [Laspinema sp. D3c]MCT7997493.1 ABC transporter G family ATP-binding protein/permease [Laspinema sp. D3c]
MNLIEVSKVTKVFSLENQTKQVLNEISFSIKPGEFVVLRGNNGSGKTTLVNMILGLLKPTSGEVKLFGYSPDDPRSKINLGVMLQKVSVPRNMKIKELINLLRSYYPNPLDYEKIVAAVNLEAKQEFWASKLSGGEEKRLYLALALAGNPKMLILDEPTTNLDTDGCSNFWTQIKEYRKKGLTILMITNNQSDWEELKHLATRTVTLSNGEIVEDKIINSSNKSKVKNIDNQQNSKSVMVSALFEQIKAESLQLVRNPLDLLGIFGLSSLAFLLDKDIGKDMAELSMLFFAGLILFIFSIERLGKRVATERIEGWLNLLRVTPLPPVIYLAAKVIVALMVLASTLILILSAGAFKLEVDHNFFGWLSIFGSLIIGIIPFAILGLALGYLFKPKSVDSIVGLSLPLALMTCGLPLPFLASRLENLVTFLSPFYHYAQLALWSAELGYEEPLFFHVIGLLLAGSMFGFVAIWAFKRQDVVS